MRVIRRTPVSSSITSGAGGGSSVRLVSDVIGDLVDDAVGAPTGRELARQFAAERFAYPSRVLGQGAVDELHAGHRDLLRKVLDIPQGSGGELNLHVRLSASWSSRPWSWQYHYPLRIPAWTAVYRPSPLGRTAELVSLREIRCRPG